MDWTQYQFLKAQVDKAYEKQMRELNGKLKETRDNCSHVKIEDAHRLTSGARQCPKCGVELKLAK